MKQNKHKYVVILTTTNNKKEAIHIIQSLLKAKLIVCANLIENVESQYLWQGKIEKEREYLLLLKTSQSRFTKIKEKIKKLHSYQVPEVIAFPIIEGEEAYINWFEATLNSTI